jgi:hypothetical protein
MIPKYRSGRKDHLGSRKYLVAGMIIFIALLVSGLVISMIMSWDFLAGLGNGSGGENDGEEVQYGPEKEERFTQSGMLYEDQDPNKEVFMIAKKFALIYMEATLRWTDEPSDIGYVNEPDCFKLMAVADNTQKLSIQENIYDGEGLCMVVFTYGNVTARTVRSIYLEVSLISCGDQYPNGLPHWLEKKDDSNTYTLDVYYRYKEEIQ